MAIFGAGSKWDEKELKNDFFINEKFTIGWNEKSAKDLYEAVSLLKSEILFI